MYLFLTPILQNITREPELLHLHNPCEFSSIVFFLDIICLSYLFGVQPGESTISPCSLVHLSGFSFVYFKNGQEYFIKRRTLVLIDLTSFVSRINFYLLRTFCPHLGSFFLFLLTTFGPNFISGLLQMINRDLGLECWVLYKLWPIVYKKSYSYILAIDSNNSIRVSSFGSNPNIIHKYKVFYLSLWLCKFVTFFEFS